jgi:tRNA threonylcarbamoyl adenosine modification protein YjeE
MFVGEGPGREEDLAGEPFVGRSGQLLDRLMAEELEIDRTRCYIANVVKCRPPENRDPAPEEIEACRPYLEAQIELVDPSVVVTLGNFAARLLLGTTAGIKALRGQAYPYRRGHLVPTYHPAFALRSGGQVIAEMRADLVRAKHLLAGPGADRGPWTVHATSRSPAETRALAAALASVARPGDLVLVVGDLGAGKTVFAQGFAAALGVEGPVTSPTFTLVRQYRCGEGGDVQWLAHADLYRLDRLAEVVDLAIPELLAEGAVAVVEWGDAGAPVLGDSALEVVLAAAPEATEARTLTVSGRGPAWASRRRAVEAALMRSAAGSPP